MYSKQLLALLIITRIAITDIHAYADVESDTYESAALAYDQGRYELAIHQWKKLVDKLDGSAQTDLLIRIASAYLSLGQLNNGLAALETAKQWAEQSKRHDKISLVYSQLSDVYLLSRVETEAYRYAEQAVSHARSSANPAIITTALNHLGNAYMAMQDYAQAMQCYTEAITLSSPLYQLDLTISASLNLLHVMIIGKNIDTKVTELFDAVFSKIQSQPDTAQKAFNFLSIGFLAQEFEKYDSAHRTFSTRLAYQAFKAALRFGKSQHNARIKSYATGHLGELYLADHKLPQARELFREALFFAYEVDAPELTARWHWRIGRLQLALHNETQAFLSYQKSIDQLQRIQPALVYGQRGTPHSFLETTGAIYREFADIILQKAQQEKKAEQKLHLLRQAREAMENLKTVELRNYFRDSCVTERRERNRSINLDAILSPGTATLYPIVLANRLELIIGLANGEIEQVRVHVEPHELRETVMLFRKQLSRSGNPRRLRKHGQTLHQWLIKPIQDTLRQYKIDTLVIVPDDQLRTIPFSALYDGHDFLVEQYAIAVSPGLTLTDTQSLPKQHQHVLLNGLTDAAQKYEPLPYVSQEISKISEILPHTSLLGDAYKAKNIEKHLTRTPYSAVVFATHGSFHNDPKQSHLLTYDSKISLDELDRMLRINEFREHPLDLLVLSACETAEGDERAALGFAGVAVKAGAKSVLASLWKVNDASTADLVPSFFKHLKNPVLTKAKALQQAQIQLLDSELYASPYHWASFVLIGNWL